MVKRIGTARKRTRHKLSKGLRSRGKISITRYLELFKAGERVQLNAEPAVQKGMYFSRFHGMPGIVRGKRGSCYEVEIKNRGKEKTLIVHPVHLKRLK